ncbi:MAG: ATP-binding protein [Alphaproteobacteria bacterium]
MEPRGDAGQALKALAVAALLLPLLLFAVFGWSSYESHWREARNLVEATADVVREHAIKVFETQVLLAGHIDESLRDLTDGQIRAREPEFHDQIRAIRDRLPQVQDVWVLNRDGFPLVSASRYPAPSTLDASDREYFRFHRDAPEGAVHVGEIIRGRVQGSVFFQLSRRREIDGRFAGVVAISVQPDYFEQFYARMKVAERQVIALVHARGTLLARHPHPAEDLDKAPRLTSLLNAVQHAPEGGVVRITSAIDGIDRIVAYRKLPDYPVYVMAGQAAVDVGNEWIGSILSHLVFGVPATIGLFALSLVALRRTRRESEALALLREEASRREASEAQLRQAQKMEAIGRLTGGVAHDFNNLLTVVSGNLELAMRRLGDDVDARVRRGIAGAMDGASRAAALTHRLLAFARQQPLDPKATDVNRLVGGMSDLIRRTLGETIEIEVVLAGGLWPVRIDPPQLESTLLNLAVNARDAMPNGGRLTVETANAHLDDSYARAHDEVVAGQYVMIAVSDTGLGMSPEVVARAFEPFFTTKPKGSGTGLGLSQVYGFVKQSGGHVKVYSEVGRGTTVKVYLPRAAGAEAGEEEGGPVAATGGEGALLLVVEDDPGVRMFSVEALRELGYDVVEAADAAAGLRMIDQEPRIVLIFTDVVLPGGMSGRDLAEEARRRRPDIKVVFTTGYTQNAIVHNGVLDPDVQFLGKPFTVAALGRKVEQALGEQPPQP